MHIDQDEIYSVLKHVLHSANHLDLVNSKTEGWTAAHENAWRSFTYYKLGKHPVPRIPMCVEELESFLQLVENLGIRPNNTDSSETETETASEDASLTQNLSLDTLEEDVTEEVVNYTEADLEPVESVESEATEETNEAEVVDTSEVLEQEAFTEESISEVSLSEEQGSQQDTSDSSKQRKKKKAKGS